MFQIFSKCKFWTGEEILPKKGLLEKATTIKHFEYSPFGKELKKKMPLQENNIKCLISIIKIVTIKIREMEDKSDDESIIEEFDTILENIRNNVKVNKVIETKTKNNNINLYSLTLEKWCLKETGFDMVFNIFDEINNKSRILNS